MSVGDRVKLKENAYNAQTYKEYINKIGTVIDSTAPYPSRKQYFRVAFSNKGTYGPYIDVGAWRLEKIS